MPTVFFKKIENTSAISTVTTWQPTNAQLSEDAEIAKYAPFNHLTVYNNSTQDAEVRLYGSNISDKGTEYLPAGAALVFDKEDNIQFYRPTIYNRGSGTIAVSEIILEVRRVI